MKSKVFSVLLAILFALLSQGCGFNHNIMCGTALSATKSCKAIVPTSPPVAHERSKSGPQRTPDPAGAARMKRDDRG